jgi:hypothetical protein
MAYSSNEPATPAAMMWELSREELGSVSGGFHPKWIRGPEGTVFDSSPYGYDSVALDDFSYPGSLDVGSGLRPNS